ncbi:MAG: hypothetical protein R3E01_00290 [Pirellulaceae bacterium]|nr:hypothetical protein [Planctomycetales bacterium]
MQFSNQLGWCWSKARDGRRNNWMTVAAALLVVLVLTDHLHARDYVLTIAGGYRKEGNQASLEANVLFFQQILREQQHHAPRAVDYYFADGFDNDADLQVSGEPLAITSPATDVVASLHRRGGPVIEYRNHRVPDIAGALDPQLIRSSLEKFAERARQGDRLILYVTSHGAAGERPEIYDTSISCWGDKSVSMKELTGWLDKINPDVPVVLIMAQCYCGGFANAIFRDGDREKGLAEHQRVGFFAQQHDLAAAGCRPDIENDEEFSSYYWGALVGHTRNNDPMPACDADGDGTVSFSEAYANVVVASRTIDIPLTTADVLLRTYSSIPDYELRRTRRRSRRGPPRQPRPDEEQAGENGDSEDQGDDRDEQDAADENLARMTGPLESLMTDLRPATRRMVVELAKQLEFSLTDDVQLVLKAYEDERNGRRQFGPFGRGRRRGPSGRRELLAEVEEKWPELADREKWQDSELLRPENQDQLMEELKQLPSYETYATQRKQRAEQADQAEEAELREVKLARLINVLESIVLERNLPLVADPEVVQRFRRMVELEGMTL